jgi:hypothetical protein
MYVREHIENLLAALIGERLQAEIFDHNPQWLGFSLDIDLPEGDELFRFEVLVEDLLVVADGVIDHNFELILNIL